MPLGRYCFVPATAKNNDRMLVNVGLDCFIDFTKEEAMTFFSNQKNKIENSIKELEIKMNAINMRIQELRSAGGSLIKKGDFYEITEQIEENSSNETTACASKSVTASHRSECQSKLRQKPRDLNEDQQKDLERLNFLAAQLSLEEDKQKGLGQSALLVNRLSDEISNEPEAVLNSNSPQAETSSRECSSTCSSNSPSPKPIIKKLPKTEKSLSAEKKSVSFDQSVSTVLIGSDSEDEGTRLREPLKQPTEPTNFAAKKTPNARKAVVLGKIKEKNLDQLQNTLHVDEEGSAVDYSLGMREVKASYLIQMQRRSAALRLNAFNTGKDSEDEKADEEFCDD